MLAQFRSKQQVSSFPSGYVVKISTWSRVNVAVQYDDLAIVIYSKLRLSRCHQLLFHQSVSLSVRRTNNCVHLVCLCLSWFQKMALVGHFPLESCLGDCRVSRCVLSTRSWNRPERLAPVSAVDGLSWTAKVGGIKDGASCRLPRRAAASQIIETLSSAACWVWAQVCSGGGGGDCAGLILMFVAFFQRRSLSLSFYHFTWAFHLFGLRRLSFGWCDFRLELAEWLTTSVDRQDSSYFFASSNWANQGRVIRRKEAGKVKASDDLTVWLTAITRHALQRAHWLITSLKPNWE